MRKTNKVIKFFKKTNYLFILSKYLIRYIRRSNQQGEAKMEFYRYKVVLKNMISALDQKVLTYLYLPIIGAKAMALYQFLAYEYEVSKELRNMKITEERILKNLGFSADALERQCKRLEALNLLEVLHNEKKNSKIFNIYAPLEPSDFFNNTIFNAMLLKNTSTDDYDIAKFIFKDEGDVLEEQGYTKRVTCITEVFDNVEDLPTMPVGKGMKSKPKKSNPTLKEVNATQIIEQLSENQIYVKKNDKTMKLIENIYSLYKVSLDKILNAIVAAYNFNSQKVDEEIMYGKLSAEIARDEVKTLALNFDATNIIEEKQKIKVYEFETIESSDYLSLLMNGLTISQAHAEMLKKLQTTYKLRNSVINCLLDFSYYKNDATIVPNYLYKIAGTMNELNIKTADAAMQYLKTAFKNSNKPKFQQGQVFFSTSQPEDENIWNVPQDPNGYKVSEVIDEELFQDAWGQS